MSHPVGYEYLEDIAIADIAFRAWGASLEDVFGEAGRATLEVMVDDLDSVRPLRRLEVELEAESCEWLLFEFLQELIFHKDAGRLLLLPAKMDIAEGAGGWTLRGLLEGEELDPERHPLRVDVKAVTLHRFSLRRQGAHWRAEVVLDI